MVQGCQSQQIHVLLDATQRFARMILKPKSCEIRDLAQGFGDLGGPSLDLLKMDGYLGASDITSGGLYSFRGGGL